MSRHHRPSSSSIDPIRRSKLELHDELNAWREHAARAAGILPDELCSSAMLKAIADERPGVGRRAGAADRHGSAHGRPPVSGHRPSAGRRSVAQVDQHRGVIAGRACPCGRCDRSHTTRPVRRPARWRGSGRSACRDPRGSRRRGSPTTSTRRHRRSGAGTRRRRPWSASSRNRARSGSLTCVAPTNLAGS